MASKKKQKIATTCLWQPNPSIWQPTFLGLPQVGSLRKRLISDPGTSSYVLTFLEEPPPWNFSWSSLTVVGVFPWNNSKRIHLSLQSCGDIGVRGSAVKYISHGRFSSSCTLTSNFYLAMIVVLYSGGPMINYNRKIQATRQSIRLFFFNLSGTSKIIKINNSVHLIPWCELSLFVVS